MSNYPDGVTVHDLPDVTSFVEDKSELRIRFERIQAIRVKRRMIANMKSYREPIKPIRGAMGIEF